MHRHTISFRHAFAGLLTALRTQPNFRIHLALSALAIGLGVWRHLDSTQWALLSLVIALGLVVELINTAIEFTVDLITQEHNLLAKYAKDVSAAAMLIYAFGAVVVALWLFI